MVPRYARPAMVAIWEPEERYRIWFAIEAHATEKLGELREGQGKAWAANLLVDGDRAQTAAMVRRLVRLAHDNPGLTIIPAHDGDLQARLGLFPRWID